mgnify:CR=1 FL=1
MRVALMGDLHANLPALEAVLDHARQEGTYSGVVKAAAPIVPDVEISMLSQLPAWLDRV